jgi:hypothetical protein
MRRLRQQLLGVALCGTLGVAGTTLVACSGGGDDDTEAEAPAATTTTTEVDAEVALTAGGVNVFSAGPEVALDDATQRAILALSQEYVDTAILAPLVTGEVGSGYDALFDAAVQPNAVGPDRASLTEEGSALLTESPTVNATPLTIAVLADQNGGMKLIGATFDVDVLGALEDGPLRIHRSTELTFAPSGPNGAWVITAYRANVQRDEPAPPPTTGAPTSAPSTTTGASS